MRIVRRFLQVTLLVVTIAVGAVAGAMIVSQTPWFRDWLRGFIVRQADQYLNGRLTIGRLGGNIFFGIELEDVAVTMNGEPVITIKDAGLAYSVLQLLTKNLVITRLRLDRPLVHMRREGGAWALSNLIKPRARETNRTGPGLPVAVQDIVITGGNFVFDDATVGTRGVDVPHLLNRLDARLSFAYAPGHYTIDISNISFSGELPQFALNQLSGKVSVNGGNLYLNKVAVRTAASDVEIDGAVYNYTKTPSLDMHVTSDKLDLDEIARVIPPLGHIDLKPALDVIAKGPLDNLRLHFDVKSPTAGEVAGDVVLDMKSPERRIAGTIHTRDIDVGAIVRKPSQATAITGVTTFDLRLLDDRTATLPIRATYDVHAQVATAFGYLARDLDARGRVDGNRVELDATATAYGARASVAGTITVPIGRLPLGFDLRGHVADADLRQLPPNLKIPRPATRLNLVNYHVTGRGSTTSGDALLGASTLAGATIGDGTRATYSYSGGDLAYTAAGSVAALDLQRIGQQFGIEALQANRFRSHVNGQFNVSGSGTTVAKLRLQASGNLANSSLLGMTASQVAFEATIADRALQTKTSGQFRDLNPATVTGNDSFTGKLAGRFNLDVGLANLGGEAGTTSLVNDLSLSGQVALQSSQVGGVRLDQATIDGRYANRNAEIRQLAVTGPDLRVKANGTVTFTDTGQSQLTYEMSTSRLDRFGKMVDKPLEGGLTLNGQLTGNAGDLHTTGTLNGSNVGYGASQALELTSQYDIELPGLDATSALVRATTTASFLTVAGQEINLVTAKTTYGHQSLDFDAYIQQPKQSLRTAGTLLLHPDHQEVHLRSLVFEAGAMKWQIAPGSEPAIQYGNDTIGLKDVRLVSGTQEIRADGTIGPSASNLQARLTNVSLANVDAMLLSNRQLGGLLNAQASVTGPRDELNVTGELSVNAGSFGQFAYQSLTGKVQLARKRISLDMRLQENPQAWIEAAGSVPLALFGPTPTGADAAAPVDVRIQSSPIDLGMIQGFTTEVVNTTGTAQADVHLMGTAGDPELSGAIDIRDGAFKVVRTGVSYRSANSHVDLQADRVTVKSFTITDEHGAALQMTGDLALQERQIGTFNVKMNGKAFEVLHNDLGEVRLNPNVTLGGDIRQPHVTGTLGVDVGKINIDKVLDLATSSAYSTSAEAAPVAERGEPASQPIGQPVNQPAGAAPAAPVTPGAPPANAL